MRETLAAVSSLIGERQVAWVIDPEAFARHRIERAPTFVLSLDDRADTATSCGTDCRTPPAFVSVSGRRASTTRWTRWPGSAPKRDRWWRCCSRG